jgi:hypothetical protein
LEIFSFGANLSNEIRSEEWKLKGEKPKETLISGMSLREYLKRVKVVSEKEKIKPEF